MAVVSPVTVDELKAYLRISGTAEDSDLADLLLFATDFAERETQRASMRDGRASSRYVLDAFPDERWIAMPFPPLASVASVEYVDTDGVTQTIDEATYIVDTDSRPGRIALKAGESWPATAAQAGAVAITYAAGYADAADVPPTFKQLVKWVAGHAYENREAVTDASLSEMPLGVRTLVEQLMFRQAIG